MAQVPRKAAVPRLSKTARAASTKVDMAGDERPNKRKMDKENIISSGPRVQTQTDVKLYMQKVTAKTFTHIHTTLLHVCLLSFILIIYISRGGLSASQLLVERKRKKPINRRLLLGDSKKLRRVDVKQ